MTHFNLLLRKYMESDSPPIILLESRDGKTVAALYTNALPVDDVIISETNNAERYFLLVNGVGVYFSYWKKLGESELKSIE